MMNDTRTEADSMGAVAVPAAAYWGAQTQRSLVHFAFPGCEAMPLPVIHALALVKQAAARVNRRHGLAPDIADAIEKAAAAICAGAHDDQFPLAIWQTGSGTQTNMNVNEVVAGLANEALAGRRGGKEPVHPNDHVNRGQSSNDSFPTALHMAAMRGLRDALLPVLRAMQARLLVQAAEWDDIVKIGRTHLQDATPLTLGQEFSGYAAQLGDAIDGIEMLCPRLCRLAQGGTAVGTGLNAPQHFDREIVAEIAALTGLPFTPAPSKFAALAANDDLVALSGALNTLAVALTKIANDIRLMASGPRAGIGELVLPENEPGSSIMPGKVNPTQCEMLTMIAAQVIGNHHAVTVGGLQGHFELNVFKPMIGANVLRSIALLAQGVRLFTAYALDGLQPDRARIAALVERSLMLVTALAPAIGYDAAARIAKYAHDEGLTLREAALSLRLVDEATFDRLIRPETMVGR